MRRFSPLLGALMVLACGRETALAPPRQVDRVSALKADITGDFLKPNPPPEAWMLGCYSVPALMEWKAWPARVELTNEPRQQRDLVKLSYGVRHLDANVMPPLWSWQPVTQNEIRLSIGDRHTIWELTLRRAPNGLRGEGELRNCVGVKSPKMVELVRIACR